MIIACSGPNFKEESLRLIGIFLVIRVTPEFPLDGNINPPPLTAFLLINNVKEQGSAGAFPEVTFNTWIFTYFYHRMACLYNCNMIEAVFEGLQ